VLLLRKLPQELGTWGIPEMDCSQRGRQIAVCGSRSCRVRLLNTGLVFALLLSIGLAAKTQTGTISGTVRTEAGVAIPRAKVIVKSSAGNVLASTLTDDQGRFRFPPFMPGTYELEVELHGQWKTDTRRVLVKEDHHTVLNLIGRHVHLQAAGKSDGLGPVKFYDDSDFKQGELKDPSGGGGYSNAASAQAVKILNQYISSEGSSNAQHDIGGSGKSCGSAGSDEAALERSGRMLLAKKNYSEAAKVFEKATAMFPCSERLRMGLGLSLYGAGKYPEATGALREAARLAPDDSAPIVMLAETLQFVQDPAAESLLERFSKLHPEKAGGHYAYGLSLWRDFRMHRSVDKLADAQSEFEKAVSLDPNDADARLQLGMVYDEQKAPARAVAEYLATIRVNPRLASAHYRLAQDYERLGEKEKAAEELSLYQRLGGHQ
jgi:tetratricopeptide (TPR) repeat protein